MLTKNCAYLPAKYFWALLSYRWSTTWASHGEGNHSGRWRAVHWRLGREGKLSQKHFTCFSPRPWLWGIHSDTLTNVSQTSFLTSAKLCGRPRRPPATSQMGTWKAPWSLDKQSKIWGKSTNQANICHRSCFWPPPCHGGGLLAQLDLCSLDLYSVF